MKFSAKIVKSFQPLTLLKKILDILHRRAFIAFTYLFIDFTLL